MFMAVEAFLSDRELHFAIEYDRKLNVGLRGQVAYLTVGHQPVRVSCSVRRCAPMDNGRFLVGLKLDRLLNFEEKRIAKASSCKLAALGLRSRKLRPAASSMSTPEPQPVAH